MICPAKWDEPGSWLQGPGSLLLDACLPLRNTDNAR